MKIIKNFFRVLLLCVIIFVGIKINEGYQMYKNALTEMTLQEKVTEIKNKDNYTSINELPQIYIDAVVAVEDHRFFQHNGIDIVSIARAVFNDIKAMKFVEGGSTITQQLAKNAYFTQEKNITRKVAEVFMAFEFEKNYSKNDILEFYLNTSYFGEGCYTIKDASKVYFNKEPIEMSDYESIMLAGIPNAPSVYAPTVNLNLAKERQLQVIQKMIKYEVLTEKEAKKILEGENNE